MKQHRNTRQRQIVLDVVTARRDHPSADQVYIDVREKDSKISRGTVFRNLNILAEEGDILQVRLPDFNRYDWRTDLHYHFMCTECGAVFDAPLKYSEKLDRIMENETSHKVNRHSITFEGICKDCQNQLE